METSPIPPAPILVTDTITMLGQEHAGHVVVCGSHGGRSSGQFALRAPLSGVIFNDAGRGIDDAGISGILDLDRIGLPAAAAGYDNAEIGNGADTMEHGFISICNAAAATLGVASGMSVAVAAGHMAASLQRRVPIDVPVPVLRRQEIQQGTVALVLIDSISMLGPADRGRIVVSGSHGGNISSGFVLAYPPALSVFNDAGIGRNRAGIACLSALDAAGHAAVAVGHMSGRIGDPMHMLQNGVISVANQAARSLGLAEGAMLHEALILLSSNEKA